MEQFLLIAVTPPNLHCIHYARESDVLPICGTASINGFECVGNTERDGHFQSALCLRCKRKFERLRTGDKEP
jgi:hypothetical protein